MIKINYGSIGNPETGVTKDIVVKSAYPIKFKHYLVGFGLVCMGVYYLTSKAFRFGGDKFVEAEIQAMKDCDLI